MYHENMAWELEPRGEKKKACFLETGIRAVERRMRLETAVLGWRRGGQGEEFSLSLEGATQ